MNLSPNSIKQHTDALCSLQFKQRARENRAKNRKKSLGDSSVVPLCASWELASQSLQSLYCQCHCDILIYMIYLLRENWCCRSAQFRQALRELWSKLGRLICLTCTKMRGTMRQRCCKRRQKWSRQRSMTTRTVFEVSQISVLNRWHSPPFALLNTMIHPHMALQLCIRRKGRVGCVGQGHWRHSPAMSWVAVQIKPSQAEFWPGPTCFLSCSLTTSGWEFFWDLFDRAALNDTECLSNIFEWF